MIFDASQKSYCSFLIYSTGFIFYKPLSHKGKNTMPSLSFSSFLAHQPLLLSRRFEFISNQRATNKRPILIIPSFTCLHINDCRLCCFSAAVVPLPSTLLRQASPHAETLRLSLSSRPHALSLKLTFTGGHFIISPHQGNRFIFVLVIKTASSISVFNAEFFSNQ